MYNLIEYSDNYLDTPGTLWQFKRDDVWVSNANVNIDSFQSFKQKKALAKTGQMLIMKISLQKTQK